MFDRIAPRYDLLNRLLSAGTDVRWRRRAVDLLDPGPSARVLDLCTGTADILVEVLSRAPAGWGLGVDLSRAMLTRGAAKLRRRGLEGRARLVAGDSERLPLAAGRFDGALVAFGIRNVRDPLAALVEMHRALRPGGRCVVLEFSLPAGVLGGVYRLYFQRILPLIGGLVSGHRPAYTYLPASVAAFAGVEELASLMEEAGFVNVRWRRLSGGVACLHSGDRTR
jgi:demethylmenaquinone methyltransferase/2-methoxy-6-polyprenyl-1,4-benzoquinol methylase